MISCKQLIDYASNKKNKKYKYKANKRAILAKIKQCFVKIFWEMEKIYEVLDAIIKTVAKESVPIREGRKYPRSVTKKAKRKTYRAYVPVVYSLT